ncbi:MAG: FAD-dependent monooxygenase [Thermomicrobiales bacterium]
MTDHAVIVVGAGPTGLMLAGELALAGVEVVVIERRPNQDVAGVRARGVHARTIEVFDQRGLADRFLAEGTPVQNAGFGWIRLDMSDAPSRYPFGLALWQKHIERILAGWIADLGVPVLRGQEVIGCSQDESGVTVDLSGGASRRARWLVGCDGGRSVVRKAAGIAFPGWDATISHVIAGVEFAEEPQWGLHRDEHGIHSIAREDGEDAVQVMLTEPVPATAETPTLDDLRALLTGVYGTDFGVHSPRWISRFSDMARQAETYRAGRILLAGDAAHIHYPTGGQGLNLGVQDAVNLGWKLAQVVDGRAAEALLDTYHAERHPVGARVIRNTLAQVALLRTDPQTEALRESVGTMLAMEEPRRVFAGMMSGLDIHYDLGEGHPLLGRRMPDIDLVTDAGPTRVYSLLHAARPILIRFARGEPIDLGAWSGLVASVEATSDGPWALPVIGPVDAPSAVLIRPDGYVAWVGEGDARGLRDALVRWCGENPAAA